MVRAYRAGNAANSRFRDDDGQAQGHPKDVAVIAMAGGADDEALRGIAQSEEGQRQRRDGEIGIDTEKGERRPHREHRPVRNAPWAKLMMCSTP